MIAKKFKVPSQDIPYILKNGEERFSGLFIVRIIKNNAGFSRYRVIVSRKMDRKAVGRNRLRRQVYEAIRMRHQNTGHTGNNDLILIPKKIILGKKYVDIETDISHILGNLNK
ncbi:ribonuclease P protein component [Candidatus Peregrinibacteria bacterium]|nr:ribonuclease P protein component [Candidatus Peregrinibacteria bacterium]